MFAKDDFIRVVSFWRGRGQNDTASNSERRVACDVFNSFAAFPYYTVSESERSLVLV